jgi:hypothetical protein
MNVGLVGLPRARTSRNPTALRTEGKAVVSRRRLTGGACSGGVIAARELSAGQMSRESHEAAPAPFHNLSFCESTRQSLSSPADDEIDIAFVFRHRFSFPFMR